MCTHLSIKNDDQECGRSESNNKCVEGKHSICIKHTFGHCGTSEIWNSKKKFFCCFANVISNGEVVSKCYIFEMDFSPDAASSSLPSINGTMCILSILNTAASISTGRRSAVAKNVQARSTFRAVALLRILEIRNF